MIRPASTMDATLRVPVQEKAGRYPLGGFAFFGRDSIILVFVDSNYTGASRLAGTWMFGPAVTPVEADGCPPEKVIGRQIARVLFRALGRPGALKTVIVAVHGTRGLDRWSVSKMYFYPEQLTGKWAGDPIQ